MQATLDFAVRGDELVRDGEADETLTTLGTACADPTALPHVTRFWNHLADSAAGLSPARDCGANEPEGGQATRRHSCR